MDISSRIAAPLAAQGYASARPVTEASDTADIGTSPVATAFEGIGNAFVDTLRRSENTARGVLTGGADAHSLVEALAASQLAVETAVTVRDKVVEAYQEILRMPV